MIYKVKRNELYHHGIKGMRWGIRRYQNPDGTLTDEGKKRYDSRQDRIKKNTSKIDKYNKEQKKIEKELKNLERYGVKSKAFNEHVSEHDDYDRETGEPNNHKKVYYVDSQPDDTFSTKEEALEYLKDELVGDIALGKRYISEFKRQNDILMNAPINSKTFLENESRSRKVAAAIGLGTAGAATAAVGAAGGIFSAILALPFAAVAGVYAGISAGNVAENIGVKKEYRKG